MNHRYCYTRFLSSAALLLALVLLPARARAQTSLWVTWFNSATRAEKDEKPDQAEQYFLKALAESERFAQPDIRTAVTEQHLARFYKDQGRAGEAEAHLQRAYTLATGAEAPSRLYWGVICYELAGLYLKDRKLDVAESLARSALSIFERPAPENSMLFEIYFGQDQIAESLKATVGEIENDRIYWQAESFRRLGQIYMHRGDWLASEAVIDEAISLLQSELSRYWGTVASFYEEKQVLAVVQDDSRKLEDASRHALKSLALGKGQLTEKHEMRVRLIATIWRACHGEDSRNDIPTLAHEILGADGRIYFNDEERAKSKISFDTCPAAKLKELLQK